MQASPVSAGTLEAQNIRAILPHLPSDRFVRPYHCPFFGLTGRLCGFFLSFKGQGRLCLKQSFLPARARMFFRTYSSLRALPAAFKQTRKNRVKFGFCPKNAVSVVKVAKIYKKTCERVQKRPNNLTI